MRSGVLIFAVGLIMSLAGSSSACVFDTDCAVGSKCVKAPGALYGICAGGLNPGNDYDKVPVEDPLDPNETVGDTCSFDVDCGPGSRCFKKGGIYGVCVRR